MKRLVLLNTSAQKGPNWLTELFAGSCYLTTVTMTDAMQMTVSKKMAKRIEDNNATQWPMARELERISKPC